MRRSGATLVETLVGLVVALVVLGAAFTLVASLRGMGSSSELGTALSDSGFALTELSRDMRQAVLPAGSTAASPVAITGDRLSLVRGVPEASGRMTGESVTYQVTRAPDGLRLKRTAAGRERELPGVYRSIRVIPLGGAGGPYVRIAFHLAAGPAPGAAGDGDAAVISALVRLSRTELEGSRFLAWSVTEAIRP